MTPTSVMATLIAAFENDPLYEWLFADVALRPRALDANFAVTLTAATERGVLTTNDDASAVALWTAPGVHLLPDAAPFIALLEEFAPRRRGQALAGMAACARYSRPDDAQLHVMAVHPSRQRSGHGARLLRPHLHDLDRRGIAAYLESSNEANVPFYRRCGFVVLGAVPLADGGPIIRPMRRLPQTGSAL